MSLYKLSDLQKYVKAMFPAEKQFNFVPLGTNYDVDVYETPAGTTGRIHEVYNNIMPSKLSMTFHLGLKGVANDCFVRLSEAHALDLNVNRTV